MTQHTTTFPLLSFVLFLSHFQFIFSLRHIQPTVHVSPLSHVASPYPACPSLSLSGINSIWNIPLALSLCPPHSCVSAGLFLNLLADLHLYQNPPPSARPAASQSYSRAPPTSERLQTDLTVCQEPPPTPEPDRQGHIRLSDHLPCFQGRREGTNLCTWPKLLAISCHTA